MALVRVGRLVLAAVVALTSLAGAIPPAALAQEPACTLEVEPNDQPDALPSRSGWLCVEGTLPAGDQDLVLWDRADQDAATPVLIVLDGVPDTVTGLKLYPIASEPGVVPIVPGTQLAEVSSPVDANEPVVVGPLLLPAGRMLLGISRSGTMEGGEPVVTDYRYTIEAADPLPPNLDAEPNDTPETASGVTGPFDLAGDAAGSADTYAWTLDGTASGSAWTLTLDGTLGDGLVLSLADEDGLTLASGNPDRWGRVLLPDLQLAVGTYLLTITGGGDAPAPYRLTATSGALIGDAEPNDRATSAAPITPGDPLVRGRLWPEGDRDHHVLTIPADATPTLRDIKLIGSEERRLQVCLAGLDGTSIQCREGAGGAALRSLVLAPGEHLVVVSGDADADRPYAVRIDETAAAVPDFETEPNDTTTSATPFDPSIAMRGVGAPDDVDLFRLTTTGEPQLWEVRVTGAGLERLAWVRGDGTVLADGGIDADRSLAILTDVYLVPGDHWFRVGGADYRIEVLPLGPPDPNGEREPNDSVSYAQAYRLARTEMIGRLPTSADRDVFRFSLAGPERITLTAAPPADGAVALRLETASQVLARHRAGEPGVPTSLEVLLEAGDYEVWLDPAPASLGRYRFTLERGDPFAGRADEEPNDRVEQARPLPATLTAEGTLPAGDDNDWYALPPLDAAAPLQIAITGGITGVTLSDGLTEVPTTWDPSTLLLTSDGTSGLAPRYLRVSGIGDYTLTLSAPGLVAVAPPDPLPVRATLALDTDTVAAYWQSGQGVAGELTLTNEGTAPAALLVDTVTSHFAWVATPAVAELTLDAGETRVIPVEVAVGPDAWADEPVRVTIRARSPDGAHVTAAAFVTPRSDAEPVAPAQRWSVPDALLGGLDVASLALGAVVLPSVDQLEEEQLHDGKAHTGMGFSQGVDLLPVTLTVDLAGDAPVPVAGFGLNPQAAEAYPGDVPRDVELLLSADGGSTWVSAMTSRMTPLMADQWFVLPAPVPATHAMLRITSVQGGGFSQVILGEWKVIATPGVAPADTPIDLAQPLRGGHIAWIDPQPSGPEVANQWLDEDPTFQQVYLEAGATLGWAVGFRDARAARISRLEWVDPIPSTEGQRFAEVEVAISLEGAAGPWDPVGTWTLERSADGTVAPFDLPEPTWARYVRFTAQGPRETADYRDPPATLRVLEVPTGPDTPSALGEWGAGMPVGPYEWTLPPDLAPPLVEADDDDTPETARPLTAGTPAEGRIERGGDVDWFTFSVPEGDNTIDLRVLGRPLVVVALTLVDLEGFEVPMLFQPGAVPGSILYQAEVEPGATYRLKVEQPPSSIVFTFDTSGSMGPYLDYVYQAMRAFTADVTPGEEAVIIVPFDEQPLLDDWSDDPYALQDAVGRYLGMGGSSSAETALIDAATALSAREGARAVLLITDAETSSFAQSADLWRILGSVRPLVAAVHVGATSLPDLATGYMQDWARVAGGFYQYTRSHGEMDRAFDRLATWLRRPAGYQLDLATTFQEEPPPSADPGSIRVTAPEGAPATISADVGVEIILDTSGSMLERIRGQRRIDIARGVLRELLGQQVPAGTDVALRVFGDAADPCGTRLAVPLGPLDPAAMTALIDELEVIQETSTPLGAALAQVADDLAGSAGTKIVVLVTDGEETCGGRPAAAIRDLRRRGIDARVNLVGFALTDRQVKQTMRRWARSGNGSYFDARGEEELGRALRLAVSAPYRILDASGNEVASGTVDGAPVEVPPGQYSVVVLSDPVARFDTVEVGPGGEVSLLLPEIAAEPSPAPGAEPAS